jgi:hypothetical protein
MSCKKKKKNSHLFIIKKKKRKKKKKRDIIHKCGRSKDKGVHGRWKYVHGRSQYFTLRGVGVSTKFFFFFFNENPKLNSYGINKTSKTEKIQNNYS